MVCADEAGRARHAVCQALETLETLETISRKEEVADAQGALQHVCAHLRRIPGGAGRGLEDRRAARVAGGLD